MAVGRARRQPRALLDCPSFGEPVVYSCNAEPVRREVERPVEVADARWEAAGAAFAQRFERSATQSQAGKSRAGASESSSDDEQEEYGKDRNGKDKSSSTFKLSDLLKGVNLYELLGVSEGATPDEIKKAYRGLVLTAHPDKQATASPAEHKRIQERFVQIQEAYELLADPAKRLQYDSSLEFDESLPRFKPDSGEDFYVVFGEAFRRNARFSVRRPVPEIGNADTRPEEWRRFYNFWSQFQSWRDPVVLAQNAGEEILDYAEAECREERRWMQRENARVAKSYKQAEQDRIAKLVQMAEKYDPRINAEKEAKKAAREAEAARRLEERLAVQRAKDEEIRKRREAEEAAKAAEAERRREEKALREAAKAGVKKCRQRLRSFHPQVQDFVLIDQLNEVCLRLEEQALRELGDEVEAALKEGSATAASVLHRAIESIGLKPVLTVAKDDETASTSSGPSQSDQGEDPEEVRRREEERERRAREAEARRAAEQAALAEERARKEAEKAEERKKREEQRRKEQQQAEAKKRQQEKKEEEKAKKAEQKRQKEEEQEALKKEQQREEARRKASEQAERDRQAAQARQQELEAERILQLFSADRMDKLARLERLQPAEVSKSLEEAVESDVSLRGAFFLLRQKSATAEESLDRAVALVSKIGPIWPLGLASPPSIRLPNELRNRVKKARQQLHGVVTLLMGKSVGSADDAKHATDWQRGIIDGSIDLPIWSPEDKDAEARAAAEAKAKEQALAAEAAAAAATAASAATTPTAAAKKAKEAKKTKEPKAEEDLDELLAEFGCSPTNAKKGGKKKK